MVCSCWPSLSTELHSLAALTHSIMAVFNIFTWVYYNICFDCSNYCLHWSFVVYAYLFNLSFIGVFNFDCFKFALHWCLHHSSWVVCHFLSEIELAATMVVVSKHGPFYNNFIDSCYFCLLYLSSVGFVVCSNAGLALY